MLVSANRVVKVAGFEVGNYGDKIGCRQRKSISQAVDADLGKVNVLSATEDARLNTLGTE